MRRSFDAEALRAISPAALAAFARGEGWARKEPYGEYGDVYGGPGRPEIILPRSSMLADYPAVVSRLISIFASLDEGDEVATYRSLVGADRDVIRVRAQGTDGSVPIDVGVRMVSQARDMLLAAACAVESPQPAYRAGANRGAIEYMSRVMLGQTEQGSFILTLLAPVPPRLAPETEGRCPPVADEPIERQITRRLMEALGAARAAVERTASGEGGAFDGAVGSGVSANLCEAVAGLAEQGGGADIATTWARTRPMPEVRRIVRFSLSDAGILKEAARTFRLRQPKADVTLFGTVHQLRRDQKDIEGLVTLRAMVDDKPQSVTAVLDQANYTVAVRAHEGKTPVIIHGDLERVGQRWQMTNATVQDITTGPDP
jgi:hypothetical protein